MKISNLFLGIIAFSLLPVLGEAQIFGQKKDTATKAHADTAVVKTDSALAKVDTVKVIVADTVKPASKDCYQVWFEAMRARGAKPVTDGMQQVVIALRGTATTTCLMGQVEVAGGKIKPPIFVQQEDGQYRPMTGMGKKIEPGFASTMTEAELYAISEGMSIVFRTTDQEYGRLFFYQFANKSAQSTKAAPSPTELIKD